MVFYVVDVYFYFFVVVTVFCFGFFFWDFFVLDFCCYWLLFFLDFFFLLSYSLPRTTVLRLAGTDEDGDDVSFRLVTATYIPAGSYAGDDDAVPISIVYDTAQPDLFPFVLEVGGSIPSNSALLQLNDKRVLNYEEVR